MNSQNPKIEGPKSLQQLIGEINRQDPAEYMVVGTIPVPSWVGITKHFQGIAPKNGVVQITGQISASADEWWTASFVESGNPATVTAVWGSSNYDHAGGIQRLGDLLPIGLENNEGAATVAFYDVTYPDVTPTRAKYELPIDGKASAIAITSYAAGLQDYAIMLVYQYEPRVFQVYRGPADDIAVSGEKWHYMGETNAIPDEDDNDQYQCFAMATQRTDDGDVVYLLGFRENEALVLYTVSTNNDDYGTLSYVTAFNDWGGGVEWRYGIGLQICGPQHIRIFGSSEDPSGDRDDYHFPIYYWG